MPLLVSALVLLSLYILHSLIGNWLYTYNPSVLLFRLMCYSASLLYSLLLAAVPLLLSSTMAAVVRDPATLSAKPDASTASSRYGVGVYVDCFGWYSVLLVLSSLRLSAMQSTHGATEASSGISVMNWASYGAGVATAGVLFLTWLWLDNRGPRGPAPPPAAPSLPSLVSPVMRRDDDDEEEEEGRRGGPRPDDLVPDRPPSPCSLPSVSGLSFESVTTIPPSVWAEYKPGERRERLVRMSGSVCLSFSPLFVSQKQLRRANRTLYQQQAMQQLYDMVGGRPSARIIDEVRPNTILPDV